MNEPLFIDTTIEFDKIAMESRLSDNEDTWPQEVLQELLKQHPYVGAYDVTPTMREVDGEKGYGLGFFSVTNQSARAPGPAGEALAALDGVKTVRIPIIIQARMLKEMDVFQSHDGKAYPLNKDRLRSALFRPQLFDSTSTPAPDVPLVDKLYPPGRSYHGIGASSVPVSETKVSSANPKLLMEAIGHTISLDAVKHVEEMLNGNMKLAHALIINDGSRPFMEYLAGVEPITAEQAAEVVSRNIEPDVLMFTREVDGYHLKMANSQMFAPQEVVADRSSMVEIAGEDLVKRVDKGNVEVVSTDPVQRDKVENEEIEKIKQFGEYRVKTKDGKELLGWVFPKVIDFDGTSLDMTLFTNGSDSAMQGCTAGSRVGQGVNIIRGPAQGAGFFYRIVTDGTVIAFTPGTVISKFEDERGAGYLFNTVLGQTYRIRPTSGTRGVAKLGDDEFAIPGDTRWAPMGDSKMVALAESPEEFAKTASAVKSIRDHRNSCCDVTIVSDGNTWSFRGAGVEKLANGYREGLGAEDALFMACCVGLTTDDAMHALAVSGQRGKIKVGGCKEIHLPIEKIAEARAEMKQHFDELPHHPMLLKEAAVFDDSMTVDKVLSLGFLNPENIGLFIQYLPEFEQAINKLAEMLVAIRLGMKDIPEMAAKNAMERMEEVVQGLKQLMRRDVQ